MTTEHTVVRSGKLKRKPFNSNVADYLLTIATFGFSCPRVSCDTPSFAAFTPVARGVRFNALAIFLTPIFCFASGLTLTLQRFLPSLDSGQHAFWICGPDEGLWGGVGLSKEAIDSDLEIDEGAEDAALEAAPCELGEEAFHGVEPGRRGWGEVERPAGMSRKPSVRYYGANKGPLRSPGRLGCLSVICLPQSSACQRSLVEVRPTVPVCTLVGSVGLCVRLGLSGASNP